MNKKFKEKIDKILNIDNAEVSVGLDQRLSREISDFNIAATYRNTQLLLNKINEINRRFRSDFINRIERGDFYDGYSVRHDVGWLMRATNDLMKLPYFHEDLDPIKNPHQMKSAYYSETFDVIHIGNTVRNCDLQSANCPPGITWFVSLGNGDKILSVSKLLNITVDRTPYSLQQIIPRIGHFTGYGWTERRYELYSNDK